MTLSNKRQGFSLIELLVALVVLFAVSTIVLQTAPGQAGQKNLQSTQDKLEAIRVAVVGKTSNKKGHSVVGYLQDMGGLPKKNGSDPNYFLNGLLSRPSSIDPYGLHSAPAPDSDIQFNTGWRGPYLQSVFPGDKIVDGWGNALNHGLSGNTITSIQSNGGPDEPYNAPYPSQPIVFDANDASSDVAGIVRYDNLVGFFTPIKIRVYEPDPDTGKIRVRTVSKNPSFFGDGTVSFDFPNVPAGSRAIRARLYVGPWDVPLADTTWREVPAGGGDVDDIEFLIDPLIALEDYLNSIGLGWLVFW